MIRAYETVLFDDLLGQINEKISSFFNIVRITETEYNDRVTEICMKLWERFNQGEAIDVTDEIRSILVDKDTLLSTITQSHEHRTTKLYRRQEEISQMYKGKIELLASSAHLTDLERNRKRIAEISNYLQNITRAIRMIDGGDDDND
jgi:oligoribonuclease NrnB/cAMP/cGMP phosphodiesterase (DHH superfamily)